MILKDSSIRLNRGYGVFVNSSHGDVELIDTVVADNGADGVRCIRSNPRLDDQFDRSDVYDFCMFPTTMSQTYPIYVLMEQGQYNPTNKDCSKVFYLVFDHHSFNLIFRLDIFYEIWAIINGRSCCCANG